MVSCVYISWVGRAAAPLAASSQLSYSLRGRNQPVSPKSRKANGITTYRRQRGSVDRKQARSCNHYKFELRYLKTRIIRSFIELAKQGGCFEDPNARILLGGHFDGYNKVGGLTCGTEHTSTD